LGFWVWFFFFWFVLFFFFFFFCFVVGVVGGWGRRFHCRIVRTPLVSAIYSIKATKLPIVYALSFTVIFCPPRLQFRFVHHQAAMIVALRHAVDFLLVRAATTPSIIAEPSHMDEKILHVMKSLSRANAGWFGVKRGGGNQFHQRGHPPG